jgi:hypothetical protein
VKRVQPERTASTVHGSHPATGADDICSQGFRCRVVYDKPRKTSVRMAAEWSARRRNSGAASEETVKTRRSNRREVREEAVLWRFETLVGRRGGARIGWLLAEDKMGTAHVLSSNVYSVVVRVVAQRHPNHPSRSHRNITKSTIWQQIQQNRISTRTLRVRPK